MGGQDHTEVIPTHNEKFLHIEKAIGLLQSFDQKMIEVTSNQNASLERIHERLDDWEEQTKAIIRLGTSVEHMVDESKKTQESVGKAMELIQDLHIRTRDIEKEKYEDKFKEYETEMDTIKAHIMTLENKAGQVVLKYLEKALTYLLVAGLGFIILAIASYAKNQLLGG